MNTTDNLNRITNGVTRALRHKDRARNKGSRARVNNRQILLNRRLSTLISREKLRNVGFSITIGRDLYNFGILVRRNFPDTFSHLTRILHRAIRIIDGLLRLLIRGGTRFSDLSYLLVTAYADMLFRCLFPASA